MISFERCGSVESKSERTARIKKMAKQAIYFTEIMQANYLNDFKNNSEIPNSVINSDISYEQKIIEKLKAQNELAGVGQESIGLAFELVADILIDDGHIFDKKTSRGIATSIYDDKAFRIDKAAKIQIGENKTEADYLDIGLDITTDPKIDSIYDKFNRATNDEQINNSLPFGFSKIKYYKDTETNTLKNNVIVPRYIVGVGSNHAEDLLLSLKHDKKTDDYKIDAGLGALTSFKMLYEISLQNQLYLLSGYESGAIEEDSEEAAKLEKFQVYCNNRIKWFINDGLPFYIRKKGENHRQEPIMRDKDEIIDFLMTTDDPDLKDETFNTIVNMANSYSDEQFEVGTITKSDSDQKESVFERFHEKEEELERKRRLNKTAG